MRLLLAVSLGFCACAAGQRGLPVPDSGVDLGSFIDHDSGVDPGDMAHPIVDFGTADLTGADLAGTCPPVINEVQTDGAGGAADEWIELYNPCPQPFLLTGWTLKYRSATGVSDVSVASLTGSIAGHGYYLVANTGYAGSADIKPFVGGGLAKTGGGLGLKDPSGTLTDGVGWGNANNAFVETSAAVAPATSRSIARKPDGTDTNHNNTDFADSTPTPKASN